jgi:hypothetical protein
VADANARQSALTLSLSNTATGKTPPIGATGLRGIKGEIVSIYAPFGATNLEILLGSKPIKYQVLQDSGRSIYIFNLVVNPGQTKNLTVSFTEPISAEMPVVLTTPTLLAPTLSATEATKC